MKPNEAKDHAKLFMKYEAAKDLLRRIRQGHRCPRRKTKLTQKHIKDINQMIGE